jgi:hypothetical protein
MKIMVGWARTGDVGRQRGCKFYEGKVCEIDEKAEESGDNHVKGESWGGDG